MTEPQKVTVGLVCYKEKEQLSLILKSLAEQTARRQIGEVLLAQNSSCKRTLAAARSFLTELPLKILPHPENHIGKARALIVRRAAFPLLAFTDADCTLSPDWLKTLLLNWEHCKAFAFADGPGGDGNSHITARKAAAGVAEPDNSGKLAVPPSLLASPAGLCGPNRLPEKKLWQKAVNLSLCHLLGHGRSPQAHRPKASRPVSHLPTTNALFSVAKIKTAGNFSEKCHPVGEDLELGRRLSKIGPLYLFPLPVVINNCADTYFEYLKRLFRFGRVRWKNKDGLLMLAFLFAPGFCLFFVLGFYHFIFHGFLAGYFIGLIVSAFQMYSTDGERGGSPVPESFLSSPVKPSSFKESSIPSSSPAPSLSTKNLFQKKPRPAFIFSLLPAVWFLQHFTYSSGLVFGLFRR